MGLDLHHLVKPGNKVKCTVCKVLENGILVRFLRIFYGFLFQDHLTKDASLYKPKTRVDARIISMNVEAKCIHLSTLEKHLEMQKFEFFDAKIGYLNISGF